MSRETEIRAGDIVVRKDGDGRLRYLVKDARGGWLWLQVARKDNQPDRRWTGFSSGQEAWRRE